MNKSRKIRNINLKRFHLFCLSVRNALQNVHIQYALYTSLTLSPTGAQVFNFYIYIYIYIYGKCRKCLLCIINIKFIKMRVVYSGHKVLITQYMLVVCNMYKFRMKCLSVVYYGHKIYIAKCVSVVYIENKVHTTKFVSVLYLLV